MYMLLSHPLSVVKQEVDKLPPQDSLAAAAHAVADKVNTTLNLGLAPADQPYKDLQSFFSNPRVILQDSVTHKFHMTTDPSTLAYLDGYDPRTGCPNPGQGADIYKAMS
jgi:hypothetical protein